MIRTTGIWSRPTIREVFLYLFELLFFFISESWKLDARPQRRFELGHVFFAPPAAETNNMGRHDKSRFDLGSSMISKGC